MASSSVFEPKFDIHLDILHRVLRLYKANTLTSPTRKPSSAQSKSQEALQILTTPS
ncbi:hypothetical protein PIIN_10864 [Serendipita indica DSM 11827]|uniref:Uncharacterized protein n=1 Tax=Serendipita indica (strain DSM 11827) TaxID=1109443 RepID=G4TZY5_SERID|nr:hypothetical protein PIIN_10864 [Serendipita indica DSM 11827]